MKLPDASLSPTPSTQPRLVHSLYSPQNSVLSLASDHAYVYSGSQSPDISVWDKNTWKLVANLVGHTESVLVLVYAEDKKWLLSASGDSTVRIWSTESLIPLYVLNPYQESCSGDLFSLVWSPLLQTVYIGCQNTSLQWFTLTPDLIQDICSETCFESGMSTPRTKERKAHKFFDSYPQYQRKPADINAVNFSSTPIIQDWGITPKAYLNIPSTNVIDSAHWGYVYCMAIVPSHQQEEERIVTGSGDESIKLWSHSIHSTPQLIHTFPCAHGAVLSLLSNPTGETIYAGCQDGYVKVWDLLTGTLVREILVQESEDVLSLSLGCGGDLWTGSANGMIQRWSKGFDCLESWKGHEGIVLSTMIMPKIGGWYLVSGANDGFINIWDVALSPGVDTSCNIPRGLNDDIMTYALSKFISIPTVSSDPAHREDCRQGAIWLKKCLSQLGAETSLLPTEGGNPLVLATFRGTQSKSSTRPRILFYAHYDVISAPSPTWSTDPFTLTGRNGYLYGRGVTDNKGPIMAVACAAAELLGKRALGVDLVFLVEGAEEVGSEGFKEGVRKYKDKVGKIDSILVSNSTWIAEDPPCITYGLRGVVHSTLEISSNAPDLHSGIEGGAVAEPMMDMVGLLARLTDGEKRVSIPNFYDHVRPLTDEERALYKLLSTITQRPASSLSTRWREPSLTVHNIEVSGPKNSTVIPGTVKSSVSIRIVPDQDLDTIAQSLTDYMTTSFKAMNSPNRLQVSIDHTADWWLGNLDDPWFKALEGAIRDEWGVEPLRIREGGSVPSVPYLEKEFGCHALHLPMGQSTDQAHLPNERISLSNLRHGKAVVERFLRSVADTIPSASVN